MIYSPSFAARVRDLCYLGASNGEIAALLGTTVPTLERWRRDYPEFDFAWREGKAHADAKVAAALFKRAVGFDATTTKYDKDGNVMTTEVKHVAPDVGACIFWLTNRRPESWQQRVEHNVQQGITINADDMTEIEAARRIAFTLSQAMQKAGTLPVRTIEHGDIRPEYPTDERKDVGNP